MLESFVANLAESDNSLMHKADLVLQELEKEKINKYKPAHRAKAKIHTFLAWQDEPGKRMGAAITAHILNPKSKNAEPFLKWLKSLYIINS